MKNNTTQARGVSFKDAAEQAMEDAYNKLSDHGRLPVNARQILYAALPRIKEMTGELLKHGELLKYVGRHQSLREISEGREDGEED
jgi:hypothetical protein